MNYRVATVIIIALLSFKLAHARSEAPLDRAAEIASMLDEMYKYGYHTDAVEQLAEEAAEALREGSADKLQAVGAGVEALYASFQDEKLLLEAKYYASLLLLIASPLILYWALDAIPCAIARILERVSEGDDRQGN